MAEEGRLLGAIEAELSSAPDQASGERRALEKYGALMDETLKRAREAFQRWIEATKRVT